MARKRRVKRHLLGRVAPTLPRSARPATPAPARPGVPALAEADVLLVPKKGPTRVRPVSR